METENKQTVKEGDEIFVYINGRVKCLVDHFTTDGHIACDGVEHIYADWRDGELHAQIEE